MRKVALWCALVCSMAFGVLAYAVDINGFKPIRYIPSSGYAVVDSVAVGSQSSEFNTWYLLSSQAEEAFTIKRKFEEGWESGSGLLIPAGKTAIYNLPYTLNAAGTYWVQMVFVSTLTDSVDCAPAVK